MDKKVVIVGAGIVGLSTAYYLNKAGVDVTIIDSTDGKDNCSYGNAGYISPSHIIPLASPGIISQGLKWMLNKSSPFYIKPKLSQDLLKWGWLFKKAATDKRVKAAIPLLYDLTTQSQKLYEEILREETIEAGYHKPGLLMVCQTKEALKHEVELVEIANQYGLEASQLSKEETERMDPNVHYNMAGSVYFGCDGWMTPNAFMEQFKSLLVNNGVKIDFKTELQAIETKGNKISGFVTDKKNYQADEFVIAAGSWSPLLMKHLKIDLPLQAGKGYSFTIENPPTMPKLPSILVEARVATTPMLHGFRVAGTMEISGINHEVNPARVQGIIDSVKEAMPEFQNYGFDTIKPWAGLRPCTPDGLPYIGRPRSIDNLLVGTGHAMLGWTLGPITGMLLTQYITGQSLDIESNLLNVERYN
ncbi:FAD-binding oxidoreductase [Roseivirga sp. E12]|uniref:NAD(P)/FAD-dependent oxidoreductase n=1 Tax=Roseivirga sp. E12 TaxID=2819237 RepID=UPI001ABCCBA0|nr:FAD-dependent oxidoreductase [Roseivirga sp. E12]MBO3699411.1 FAD-dependent oxidoreductase [Roseivirga sp. E12]